MSEIKSMKSLRDRAKEFDVRLPFMDNREKGNADKLLGLVSTINEYGFLPNDDGEVYAVFTVKEFSGLFFFGGSVLTDRLTQLDAEGYGPAIREEGLPILMTKVTSKKTKRQYTNVEFFPEV